MKEMKMKAVMVHLANGDQIRVDLNEENVKKFMKQMKDEKSKGFIELDGEKDRCLYVSKKNVMAFSVIDKELLDNMQRDMAKEELRNAMTTAEDIVDEFFANKENENKRDCGEKECGCGEDCSCGKDEESVK